MAAGVHAWWTRRLSHTPPARAGNTGGDGSVTLWRLRTTVRDTPGSLGAVCTALARSRVDIVTLQTHPLAESTVDEFLLRAPAALTPAALELTVTEAGGTDVWMERADAHDLVDAPPNFRLRYGSCSGAAPSVPLPPAPTPPRGRRPIPRSRSSTPRNRP
jgi:hypothetical protein